MYIECFVYSEFNMAILLLNRLEYLDYLIYSKTTGKPKILANKLGISERELYNLINIMKDMGAPIVYNRKKESYYYETEGGFNFRFKIKKSNHLKDSLILN